RAVSGGAGWRRAGGGRGATGRGGGPRPPAGLRGNVRASSTNQRLPSGPAVMAPAEMPGVGNSVTWPVGVMRPTVPATGSVNQRLPSGPPVRAVAPKLPPKLRGGRGNSVMVDGSQRPSRAATSGRYRTDCRRRRPPRTNNASASHMRYIKYLLDRDTPPDTRLRGRSPCTTDDET